MEVEEIRGRLNPNPDKSNTCFRLSDLVTRLLQLHAGSSFSSLNECN